MKTLKSIWTSILGSISSIIPLFFACCKTGACTAVCLSPIASILGISSASLVASPIVQSFYPLLLIFSSVAFTISYFKLYVLPKYDISNCATDCECESKSSHFQEKFSYYSFWIGLIVSIVFFSFFEFQNYKSKIATEKTINELRKKQQLNEAKVEEACCSGNQTCK